MKKYLPTLLITTFTFLSLTASSVRAEVSLVVSPPSFELPVEIGEVIQKSIKVTNNGDLPLALTIGISDFIVQDDLGTPIMVDPSVSGKYLASTWFTLEKSELLLAPSESQQLTVLIEVPPDALSGGHYAIVYFSPKDLDQPNSTGPSIQSKIGSLFNLTVAGDINYDAMIKDFSVKQKFSEFGPIEFSATIENQSDAHIRPATSIAIHDMLGRNLDTLALEEVNIFPFTSRTLTGVWDQIWGLGRYTATLTAAYGPGLTATRTLYFWIIPWKLIAAILVIVAVLIVASISIRRHLSHKADTRDTEIDELKRRIVELENEK